MAADQVSSSQNTAPETPATQTDWNEWLRDNVGIVQQNSDANPVPPVQSEPENGQLEFLLDGLERLWNTHPHIITSRPDFKAKLDTMPVLCYGGQRRPLWETYLPTQALRKHCAEFLAPQENFPFLDFGYEPTDQELAGRWQFLVDQFGVSVRDDVGFFLDLISYICESNPQGLSHERCRDMARLYSTVEQMCTAHPESESMRDICRSYLQDIQSIAVPSILRLGPSWSFPQDCFANLSICTLSKPSLKYLYKDLLYTDGGEGDTQRLASVTNFFHNVAGVPSVKWQDLVREIAFLIEHGCTELIRYSQLYSALDELCSSNVVDEIRLIFQTNALIFVPNTQPPWHNASQCVWSSPSQLSNSHSLEQHYPALQSCFARLGVTTLSLKTAYDRLLAFGKNTNARPDEVKAALVGFNTLLSDTNQLPDPVPFLKSNMFPIVGKNKECTLVSAAAEFAIADRQYLATRFAGRATLLDFSSDQVRRLKPLFKWSGLENRYLSTIVREVTFVSGGTTYPLSSPKLEVAPKAEALFRIAKTLNSPRCANEAELIKQLQGIKVLEADGISCRHYLMQNGQHIETQTAPNDLHLDDGDNITIYVPHDSVSQEVCFASVLPRRLLNWLMEASSSSAHVPDSVPTAAVEVMASILNHDVSAAHRILELQGIE